MRLADKSVLITGATGSIGKVVQEELSKTSAVGKRQEEAR